MAKAKKVNVSTPEELPVVEIIAVLDRSGSMSSLQKEAIGTYNTFLSEQKKMPGEVKFTTVLFDDHYDVIHDGVSLNDIPDMTDKVFVPRGMTALYDAVGKTINTVSERLKKMKAEDKPGKLIMVILTDGEENSSKEYNGIKVKELIKEKSDKGWEFIYLASDINQFNDSTFANVGSSMNFMATSRGMNRVAHYTNSTIIGSRDTYYKKVVDDKKSNDIS